MERRVLIATYIVVFIFIIFILKLWDMQIVKGKEYQRTSERNRLRIIDIPAPRGIIYDRNNKPFVKNIPSFDISVVREDLPKDAETISKLSELIGLEPEDIRERLERASASSFEPVKLKLDVSLEEVAKVEARRVDFPGLQVDAVVSREYIYGQLASHVIGYLGRLTFEQSRDPDFRDVPEKAFIGQWGVEKIYDRILRGSAGKKIIEVDAMGQVVRVVGIQQPVKGKDLKLTIDMKLQAEAEHALGDRVGAVVMLDVNSGEILVLASTPSFNPNLFARGISYNEWKRLVNNPQKPFLNRAIQSQYPPGSTFKIVTAIAALEEGIITKDTRVQCDGSIYFGRVFRDWKEEGHGSVDLYKAIVESCDVYFYEIGKKIEIDTLARYASAFGLGKPTGVEFEGEKSGIVPSTEWKLRTKKEQWYKGETLNTTIGQGYLTATPIQMARLMSALVNGGIFYKPHILKDSVPGKYIDYVLDINHDNVELIKEALIGVVSDKDGTGYMARSEIVGIGGKTGTTQVIGGVYSQEEVPYKYRDHAWFIAFAPEENPQVAVAVFVEHGGHGSTAAAPIAKRVIEVFFKKNAD